MGAGEVSASLDQARVGMSNQAETFLSRVKRKPGRLPSFHDRDRKAGIANDCLVDILFGGEEFIGDRLGYLMTLIEHVVIS